VRGELSALRTLGVDPVAAIVAPRVLALALTMALLDVFALLFGVAGGYVASVGVLGGTTGGFFRSFFANTTFLDLAASVLKVALFGVLIGVICAYRGLHASGGAAGVGRAVNRAVVGCLVAVFFVNLVYTQWFLAEFPEVGVFR
jgi:phospholipid/cholesterol/gamma-HCH transport system permease protein